MILAFLRAEVRQRRSSLRFGLGVGFCVLLGTTAGILEILLEPADVAARTASLGLGGLAGAMPLLAVVIGVLVGGEGADARSREELRAVLLTAGISNSGVQLRRGVALVAISASATALPYVVVAAVVAGSGLPGLAPADWGLSWAATVLPRAVIATLGWFGLVTIVPSEVAAFFTLAFGSGTGLALVQQVVKPFRFRVGGFEGFTGWEGRFLTWVQYAGMRTREWMVEGAAPPLPATSAPWDPIETWEIVGPRLLLPATLAVAIWWISAAWIGRTRRDVKPRPIGPGHPSPNIGRIWNRLRQERSPDARLGPLDRAMMVSAVLVLVGYSASTAALHLRWKRLAELRFAAEASEDPEPLPLEVRAELWEIEGEVDEWGRIDIEHRTVVRNVSSAPLESIRADLRPGLAVADARAPGFGIETHRAWDRVVFELDPPLSPGAEIDLRMSVGGTPIDPWFHLPRELGISFVVAWERYQSSRFEHEFGDFSRVNRRRRVGTRGGELRAHDLAPRLRYTTWELTPPPDGPGERGRFVREEATGPELDLSASLRIPPSWVAADSCGSVGHAEWSGTCRTSLPEWILRVGPRVPADEGEGPVFLVLPAHRELAAVHREGLERVQGLADRAWPGQDGFEDIVFWETTPEFDVDPRAEIRRHWFWSDRHALESLEQHGRLVSIHETRLLHREPLRVERVVANLIASRLLAQRKVRDEEAHLLRAFFSALMERGIGADSSATAVTSVRSISLDFYTRPILEAGPWDWNTLDGRIPNLLADLEARVGRETLREGVRRFAEAGEDAPAGGLRELFEAIQAVSQRDLERFWDDFFLGSALPVLVFRDVVLDRTQAGWVVRGEVHNVGEGRIVCPVVVETEVGQRRVPVEIDGRGSAPFEVQTPSRPTTLVLDPDQTCHRWWRNPAAPLAERIELGTGETS